MSHLSARPFSAPVLSPRMARVISSLVSVGLAASALWGLNASAQTSTTYPSPRDAVVVTGTRLPTRLADAIAEVTVIDRAALDQATGRTLAELLAQQPGVQFSSNGGLGKTSSVNLRGFESRHTLLLIDGVPYGSATLGLPMWENIPLESIERIEVARGPLSALYGSAALGGVVQVFTRRGSAGLQVNGSATAGSRRYGQLSTGARYGQGDLDGAVQLQHTENRGFSATNANVPFGSFNPDNDGFRQNSGSAQLGWRFAEGWRADARVLRADGITQYDDGVGADTRAGLRSEVLSLQVAGAVTAAWRTSVLMARSTDRFDTLSSASMFTDLGVIGSVQRQLSWENTIQTPWGSVLALADHVQQTVSKPATPFDVSQRTINGVAGGLSGRAGAHNWQLFARRDNNSQFGSETTGTLGYGMDISGSWRASASLGTGFVAPSFNQLYFPGFGNPNLLPERGTQGELSLRWAGAGQQVRAAHFGSRIRGYISSGPAPANIPRARIDGSSLSYQAQLANWTLAASADHVDPRNHTEGSANFGRVLPRRAQDSLKAAADLDIGAWRLGGTLAAFGERFDNAANTTRLSGYATLDLRADWKLAREWTLGLRVNNVGDKAYETVFGYNQPGREAYLALRYSGL